ncbi:MAG: 4'-phosphopantetheinyl transferase superfamily protein [Pseudoxanthomonas sp.]
MFPDPLEAPIRLWLLPHPRRERGEPHVRPLLCQALGCADDDLPLSRGSEGRPLLGKPYADFDAGWSHSGDALLLALGASVQLGVDIEQVRPRPRARQLAQRFFHPDEYAWLATQPQEQLEFSFVRLWCAKEAVLKAHGKGLSFGLEKLVFEDTGGTLRLTRCDAALGRPEDWTTREWTPIAGYHAALAWRPLVSLSGVGAGWLR